MPAWITGFLTSISLIMVIGAQNVFVLRQGLKREHVFWLCLFCGLSDALLIAAGVAGFGFLVTLWPPLPRTMAYAGAAFLVVYALTSLRAAWMGNYAMTLSGGTQSLAATLAMAAAFTWANPHVYLDTLALMGAISTSFHGPTKWVYWAGATAGSFVYFFALGYGARLLAPYMQSVRAWRVLDMVIAAIMFWVAAGLILQP